LWQLQWREDTVEAVSALPEGLSLWQLGWEEREVVREQEKLSGRQPE
jgi:hypothetical protein